MRRRLEKFYEAIETSDLTLEVPPRIFTLRHREKQLGVCERRRRAPT